MSAFWLVTGIVCLTLFAVSVVGHLRYLGITPRYLWNNLRKIRELQGAIRYADR
ncbi:MAG: hypothetical protein VX610_07955 [SAR324 cluster bacterium]|nr:hypothetical protein [SAR324 cluster bacterium]